MGPEQRIPTVVVADDHPLYREGVKSVLERGKVAEVVGEAAELEQAAAMVKRMHPEVVLLAADIVSGSSLRLLASICESGAGRVIIVGDEENGDAALEWVKAGASGYLSRRAGCEELSKAVQAAQRGEPWIARRVAGMALDQLRRERPSAGGKPLLSPREQEVIRLVARGWRNSEVAAALYISEKTVKTHLSSIYQKLGVRDRLQAALAAVKDGLADGRGRVR